MKQLVPVLALACAAAHAPVHAFSVGVPVTFTKLVWSFSTTTSVFAGCNQIIMDATGDVVTSDYLVLAGALVCGNSAYVVSGAAYFANTGSLNMSFSHGGYTTTCGRISGLSGTCSTYDGAGALRGTSFVRLL